MAQQHLDFGSPADADGETPYTAWPKVEENFTELFSRATALEDNVRTVAKGGTGASTATNARINLYAAPFDAMAYSGLQVNGFHQVSQENGDTAVGSGAYPSDQFVASTAGGIVATFKRVATPFASRLDIPRGIEIEVTTGAALTSGHMLAVSQRIEGERLRGRLLWGAAIAKPLSVGFVVRSTVSGRAYISVANSGGARARPQAFDLVANTDTWVPLTFPGDTSGTWPVDTGVGLIVRFCFAAGSTFQGTANAWQSANVFGASDITNFGATTGTKIWVGPVVVMAGLELPTFAEVMACQRPYPHEETDASRYWEAMPVIHNNSPSSQYAAQRWGVKKRVAPSLSTSVINGSGAPSSLVVDSVDGTTLIVQNSAPSGVGTILVVGNARL